MAFEPPSLNSAIVGAQSERIVLPVNVVVMLALYSNRRTAFVFFAEKLSVIVSIKRLCDVVGAVVREYVYGLVPDGAVVDPDAVSAVAFRSIHVPAVESHAVPFHVNEDLSALS